MNQGNLLKPENMFVGAKATSVIKKCATRDHIVKEFKSKVNIKAQYKRNYVCLITYILEEIDKLVWLGFYLNYSME